jgi:hypothetical protein
VRRNNAAAIAVGSVPQPKLGGVSGASGRLLRPLSSRETWLAACLGLLALGAAAVYAQSWSAAQRDRVANAEADLTLARSNHAIALQKGTSDAPAAAQLAAIADWSTHARSFWMARLAIEQRLDAAAVAAHLPAPEIRIAQALEDGSDTPLLKAEVSGPYVAGPWLAFMRTLGAQGPSFVVDKLDVSDANTAQFALVLLFPVTLDEPPPAEPAP